jgi:hypothetical protein
LGRLVTSPHHCGGRQRQAAPAANPLLGLWEFQHEYDEPQVEGQMFQQQDNQKK